MSDPGRVAYLAFISDAGIDDDWDGVSPSMRHAWAMVEASLHTPCEARLSNIERALEIQAETMGKIERWLELESETLDAMKTGINTLGAQFNQITSTVGQFAARFANMGPAGMMKAMMGRGKPDGD